MAWEFTGLNLAGPPGVVDVEPGADGNVLKASGNEWVSGQVAAADISDATASGIGILTAADNDAVLDAMQPELDNKVYGIVDYYVNNDLELPENSVSSANIVNGTIVDADINASAGISKTKLASNVQASLDGAVQKSGDATGLWLGSELPETGVSGVLYAVVL